METKNQMLKILPFNSLIFSDSSVSFSSKSESYKFFPSKQIFGIWAWAVGTGGLLMGLIMWSNVPPIIPKCYTKKFFDFQKIHFYILPVSYFRLMLSNLAANFETPLNIYLPHYRSVDDLPSSYTYLVGSCKIFHEKAVTSICEIFVK